MEFGFNEAQNEVRELSRKMLTELVTAENLSRFDEYSEERFDRDLWAQLATAGLLGVAIDEKWGGMGFGFTELALLLEEAGRTIAPAPLLSCLVSSALPLQEFGSQALCERLLPGVASGELILTAALMEPGNENPAAPSTRAEPTGDADYRLFGSVTCVPFATQADYVLVAAQTTGGVIVCLVGKESDACICSPLRVSTYEPQYRMDMDGVFVPADRILAGPSEGARVMQWIAQRTIAATCAHQTGVVDQSMRMTASYTSERQQFGVPVATFQAVGHRAANCFIDVECLRLTTYQAVSLLSSDSEASIEVAIAKIWAGDVGHRVSYASQHMHGGMGIDRDYPLWRYCLWARQNELMLGSSSSMLAELGERIAAGEAFCA